MSIAAVVPEEAPATAYQTLISVNSIDQEQFKSSDRKAVEGLWCKVFVQNTVSEEIFDAIAAKSGELQAKKELASNSFAMLY